MWLNSPGRALLREVEDDLLGLVDELGRLARALPAEARDLAAGPDEPAERGRLADDLRVVAGVRARRDESRQLVDARFAADVLELAPLVELVDERDRVDRLALRVQRERRAVDLGVALAVELAPVAREISLTAAIAPGESIIAPRTDSSASRFWGGTGRSVAAWLLVGHPSHDRRGLVCRVCVHSLLARQLQA